MTRTFICVTGALVALSAAGGLRTAAAPAQSVSFEVDPLWPRPLPPGQILGSVTGVAVDGRNHVWIVHRGAPSLTARTENGLGTDPKTAETCCEPAPPVLEFDASGQLVGRWGGPGQGYDWPRSPGAIAVDGAGNVWITAAGPPPAPAGRGGRAGGGAAGRGGAAGGRGGETPAPPPPAEDAHVLKFSSAGKFLLQIGRAGNMGTATSQDALNKPSGIDVDTAANEVYVADTGSNRVVVFDATTGKYKRHWGANGAPFQNVTCVAVSTDKQVYVCDRATNRIQVFRADGTFVKEARVAPETTGNGAVWDVAFSRDQGQSRLFVADGQNQKVWILNRDTLQTTGSVGAGGRWPGHFYAVTGVAVDSQGNLYTAETLEGKRVQKFVAGR